MNRRLGLLIGGTVLFWLVALVPARWFWGMDGVILSATAAFLCLAPTVATFLWGNWAQEQVPAQQLAMVLGGTGIRMAVVLGAGLTLSLSGPSTTVPLPAGGSETVPYFGAANLMPFWLWVGVFYLFTLGLEVTLLIVGRNRAQREA